MNSEVIVVTYPHHIPANTYRTIANPVSKSIREKHLSTVRPAVREDNLDHPYTKEKPTDEEFINTMKPRLVWDSSKS